MVLRKIMDRTHHGYKYLFGPIPSRRLGVSLGVDLMPHKTCSLDCVYCECGKTTRLTTQRDEYTPVDKIKKELDVFLSSEPVLDHITFSGSGEPLLHNRIQDIIRFVKLNYPQYALALLTNGTLLHDPKVREEIIDIDIVKASVDTISEKTFVALNRPHPDLNAADVIGGLISFREMFQNQFWVELFLVPGMNDTEFEIQSIKMKLKEMNPDRVHINTLDRPGTEKWVQATDKEELKKIAGYFDNVELIGQTNNYSNDKKDIVNFHQHLIATIKRRPCTANDVSKVLGTRFFETKKHLESLNEKGEIEKQEMSRGVFYMMKS
jgi:wyosine [tRNA(Phe)-imidazoG37] synthetase (radical SAM superfamily)